MADGGMLSMKKFFRNDVVVVMGGQIFQLALGVVTSTLIARVINADGYGVINLLRSAFLLVATISPLGLDVALLKYCGQGENEDPLKEAVVLRLRLLALTVSAALVALTAIAGATGAIRHVYPFADIEYLFLVAFLALPFATDTALLNAIYRSRGKVARYAMMVPYAQTALRAFAVPLAIVFNPSLSVFVWITTFQIVISAGLLIFDLRRERRPAPAGVASHEKILGETTHVLRKSGWMCLSLFVYSLMRSADVMFLGAYAKAGSIGEYTALVMIAQLIAIFPMAASQSLGPNISRAYHGGGDPASNASWITICAKRRRISGYIFGGIAIFGQRLDLVFGPSFRFDPIICLLLPFGQVMSATLAPIGLYARPSPTA